MKAETLEVIAIFAVLAAAVIFSTEGESFPQPIPKTVTVVMPFSKP
jgi:hypothetical protein